MDQLLRIFRYAKPVLRTACVVGLLLSMFSGTMIYYHNCEVALRNRIAAQAKVVKLCTGERLLEEKQTLIMLKSAHDDIREEFPSCIVAGFRKEIEIDE